MANQQPKDQAAAVDTLLVAAVNQVLPEVAVAVEVDPKGAAEMEPAGTAELVGAVDMEPVGTTDMEPVGTADMDGVEGADLALCGVVAEVDTKNVLIRLAFAMIFLSCLSVISEIYTDINVNEVFQNLEQLSKAYSIKN